MDPINFKCCKNKVFNNLYCIVCFDVFHPSCIERKKHFKELGGCKIYCSQNCENKDNYKKEETDKLYEKIDSLKKENSEKNILLQKNEYDKNEEIEQMQAVINEISKTLEEKNNHIKRLNKRTRDFENEALELEREDVEKLKEQINVINDLNKQISDFHEMQKLHKSELQNKNDKIVSLEDEIKDLDRISRQMLESIKLLEGENARYNWELKNLTHDINKFSNTTHKRVESTKNINELAHEVTKPMNDITVTRRGDKDNKNKILILCDEGGRNLGRLLNLQLKDKYSIETIIKPGACLKDVIEYIDRLTKTFTLNDFVIIQAGFNDFLYHNYPSFKLLNFKLKQCLNTNLILTTVPSKLPKYEFFINKFNDKLINYIIRLDKCVEKSKVSIVDVNNKDGYSISKKILALRLSNLINNDKKNGTLIHITCNNVICDVTNTETSNKNLNDNVIDITNDLNVGLNSDVNFVNLADEMSIT